MRRDALPFPQLAAFEATLRAGSFSKAAKALNVQQPAVSRQVALLEAELGAPLFLRTKPRLSLTKEGEILADAARLGFDALRDGMRAVRAMREGEPLAVNAALGFTSLYLLPRLAEFQSLHPDVRLEIQTRDQEDDFDLERADVVVTFGDRGVPETDARPIFFEELTAIAKPSLLDEGRALSREELARRRLLHLSGSRHGEDWAIFYDGAPIRPPPPAPIDRIFSFMVYMRAIQNGVGFGLGWTNLIEDGLESGLFAIACDHRPRTERAYFACIARRARNLAAARRFRDWLTASQRA